MPRSHYTDFFVSFVRRIDFSIVYFTIFYKVRFVNKVQQLFSLLYLIILISYSYRQYSNVITYLFVYLNVFAMPDFCVQNNGGKTCAFSHAKSIDSYVVVILIKGAITCCKQIGIIFIVAILYVHGPIPIVIHLTPKYKIMVALPPYVSPSVHVTVLIHVREGWSLVSLWCHDQYI